MAVDSNILVYAHREDSVWHTAALAVVRSLAEGSRQWAIPWPCIHEFLAIVTHPRIYSPPTPLEHAIREIRSWLASPHLVLLGESQGFLDVFAVVLEEAKAMGAVVHDARVAALCLHAGVTKLYSADRDFSRFPTLVTENPLVGHR